jgi:hypothetical protein
MAPGELIKARASYQYQLDPSDQSTEQLRIRMAWLRCILYQSRSIQLDWPANRNGGFGLSDLLV